MMTFRKERMVLCYNLYGKSTKKYVIPQHTSRQWTLLLLFSSSDSSPPQEELIETIQPIEEKFE